MKASIGGSMLLYIVIFVVGIVMLLLVGMLSYSKAYKVKNRIINVIEEKQSTISLLQAEIDADLGTIGYNVNTNRNCEETKTWSNLQNKVCSGTSCEEIIAVSNVTPNTNYDYCIYKVSMTLDDSSMGSPYYYVVVTFSTFNLPLVGNITPIEVSGETKMFGKKYNY